MPADHPATVPPRRDGLPIGTVGRSAHPVTVMIEALVEALAVVDCDIETLEHCARANAAIARVEHERAQRLRTMIRPEFARGYEVGEAYANAVVGNAA